MRAHCDRHLANAFPSSCIEPVHTQGYCSYTVCVGRDVIIQFRPDAYKLNLIVTSAAKKVYDTMAPTTIFLQVLQPSGLLVYRMERLPGISLKELRSSSSLVSTQNIRDSRSHLSSDFAKLMARSWHGSKSLSLPTGTIGSSTRSRLETLCVELPERLRPISQSVLSRLPELEELPCVLTHGDLVPSNIMVDPRTGRLLGLVDWAEAEMLPFGVCLYGLDEILGEMTTHGFVFSEDADICRSIFWKTLVRLVPEVEDKLQAVLLARDLGILLWHGFAFDDGSIDRVVDEERDAVEVNYLDVLIGPKMFHARL